MRMVYISVLFIVTFMKIGEASNKRSVFDLVPHETSHPHHGKMLKLVDFKQRLEMMTKVRRWRSLIKQKLRTKLRTHQKIKKMIIRMK